MKKVTQTGQLPEDKFQRLWKDRKTEPARVSMTVGEGIDYGRRKVSATVALSCDQNEKTIDAAGEAAFFKALELVRDGFDYLESSDEGQG